MRPAAASWDARAFAARPGPGASARSPGVVVERWSPRTGSSRTRPRSPGTGAPHNADNAAAPVRVGCINPSGSAAGSAGERLVLVADRRVLAAFLRAHAAGVLACDFFAAETLRRQTLFV